jgi:hypothetical protein
MTVDLRATVATDLGICVSGDIGSNHISDGSGLVMTQGRLSMDGIVNPARGTPVNLIVIRTQLGVITRFPKPMYVIRAMANPIERTSEVEIGCRLTLMENRQDQVVYTPNLYTPAGFTEEDVAVPIYAQKVLEFCLEKIGLQLDSSSVELTFRFLLPEIDLSVGYVQKIGDLLRSENCYGRILPNGKLQVQKLNFNIGGTGPVLLQSNLVSIEPVTVGAEPADSYIVTYEAGAR